MTGKKDKTDVAALPAESAGMSAEDMLAWAWIASITSDPSVVKTGTNRKRDTFLIGPVGRSEAE